MAVPGSRISRSALAVGSILVPWSKTEKPAPEGSITGLIENPGGGGGGRVGSAERKAL